MTAIAGILALLIFGGEVIRNFSFAMLFGILIGTYSSMFIAAPLLAYLGVKRETVGQIGRDKETPAAKAKAASR
jgi:preprotein translocase subunit SecF